MRSLEEKTISETTIYKGKIIDLTVADVLLPDGNQAKRELVKHSGAVAIIPVIDDKLVLVEQFRKPLEKTIIEIPAGKLEPEEDRIEAAKRELEEETGYQTDDLAYVTSFASSPGFADEVLHVYVAKKLKKADDPLAKDEDEFINVVEVSLEEAKQLIETGNIFDVKTMYAVQYLELEQYR